MDSHAHYLQKNCTKFGVQRRDLCLTPCHHMRVTLGKALSLLEPEVLTPRTFVRIKEANVYEKYFVICKNGLHVLALTFN